MSVGNTEDLAEKIAELLTKEARSDEFSSLQSGLEKLNRRLDDLERQISSNNPQSQIPDPESVHPSLEKYSVVEAVIEEISGRAGIAKTCRFEPNERPCDACSMCSSRGF